ncbi:MAG: LysM peptidoglycan-binding domain-containing protein [Flavobacteriaceae bacterium]|jgi:LysM repeat protein|nr:LysM peptidoglycan-binding domain-containing protein [Flavobacteriaceae bacterium]
MKKYFLIVLMFLLSLYDVEAQTKKYVSYTVKKGETIKSIAKDLNVSAKELHDLNPDVDKKPKENTVILIAVEVKEVTPETIQYQVQPKETIYGIAKKHQITIEEIFKLNPILVDGLKEGQIILLPKTNLTVIQTEKSVENGRQKIIHIIEKGDTLYNLAKRYQLSQEELIAQNPILKDGFNLGVELHILPGKIIGNNQEIPKQQQKTPINLSFKSGKMVNVVLMMPFKLSEIGDATAHFNNSSSLLNITAEFYQGAMVAIDSLKNQGANINLKSFDSENNDEKIISILKNNNLSNTDVFIGPLFLASAYKLAKNISSGFVVAPMNSKEHNKFNESNLIKSGVRNELLEDKILQFMKRNFGGQNIVVVGDNKPGTNDEADRIAWKLKSNSSINHITVLKPTSGYITKQRFESVLNQHKENWILIVGDDNIVITDAVNTFGIADKSINIRLFSLKHEGNIEKANNVYLGRLNYTFPSAEFSDFNQLNVQLFVNQYKEKYVAPPSSHAIRGFDVTYDILFRMLYNGKNGESIDQYKFDRVAARFDYKPGLVTGFENNGIFILKYEPDLRLTLLE